jgi:hypothetical protein
MERIFNDDNEPFWRSAKSIELGMIPAAPFADFVVERFRVTGKSVGPEVVGELLGRTGGHPYATQELCYFLWEQTGPGEEASGKELEKALGAVLHSEHAHFSLLWDNASAGQRTLLVALAREIGRPFTADYRERHELPPTTNVQKALRTLVKQESVAGEGGVYRIVEPFLAEWLLANVGRDAPGDPR